MKFETRRIDLLSAFIATAGILAFRLMMSDIQADIDEELYFQIARYWAQGFLPYVSIFDHKPPLLYALFMVYSPDGSMATVRIVCTFLLLISAIAFQKAEAGTSVHFVPLCLFLISFPVGYGSNSEIVYIPYILAAGAFLLSGRIILAALTAALCMNIKYTAALDILGCFAFCISVRNERGLATDVIKLATVTAAIFVTIFLSFYAYFRYYNIDIVYLTIIRNIVHSTTNRAAPELPLYFVLFNFACIVGGLVAARAGKRRLATGSTAALAVWSMLSILQASITGQFYFHYFLPAYIPAAIFLSRQTWFEKPRAAYVGLAGAVVLAALLIRSGLKRLDEDSAAAAEFRHLCTGQPFYVVYSYLKAYRLCPAFRPDRYMFPAFLTDRHFIDVSESGGDRYLCSLPVRIIDRGPDGKPREFANGKTYCRTLKRDAMR